MNVSFGNNLFDEFNKKYDSIGVNAKPAEQPLPTAPAVKVYDANENVDDFKSAKKNDTKVNVFRIWFNRLKQDQVDEINKTGQFPKNIKVRPNIQGTGYYMYHNIFNIFQGTRTLPEGYEVRRNILGFTRIVPKDTEGFWIGKKQ